MKQQQQLLASVHLDITANNNWYENLGRLTGHLCLVMLILSGLKPGTILVDTVFVAPLSFSIFVTNIDLIEDANKTYATMLRAIAQW